MFLRFISTIILAPIAIAAIWFGRPYFDAMVLLMGVIALMEWVRVSRAGQGRLTTARRWYWPVIGILYVGLCCMSLVYLRADATEGLGLVLAFFSIIWATDIGAYLVGRTLGGPKLAPKVSPNKTWSGALGGLVCAVLASLGLLIWATGLPVTAALVGAAASLSIVSQAGDLFESALKRRYQVKDSGGIIPGHGGVMDRFDGLWAAAPVGALFCWVGGSGVSAW